MSTDISLRQPGLEIWGGIESTINRIGDHFNDQLDQSGHYWRDGDIERFAALGIKKIRYPVLWERHQPNLYKDIDWTWISGQLATLKISGVTPIAGLLHHGSGPSFTQLDDPKFPSLLAQFAGKVAARFPGLEYYTPVNEPLTTARFSGLYGLWYPHGKSDTGFVTMLLNQVKGIILSMQAIRKINPNAKLIQTEDLSFTHSTPSLNYQAFFENHRRWLTYDLLCGRMNKDHIMWNYMIESGVKERELKFFEQNSCPPDIMGFNYYVTSERFLDENICNYPESLHGSNGRHRYVDTEAIRCGKHLGITKLISEAWHRYHLPIAITECHLGCSREEQLRWINDIWQGAIQSLAMGIDVKALTAWSLLGSYDWNSLLTRRDRYYESGIFDNSNFRPRATALAKQVKALANKDVYDHPVLDQPGWWAKSCGKFLVPHKKSSPLLIIGKTGTLGSAFVRICGERSISCIALGRDDINISDKTAIRKIIEMHKPWAIINATGYVDVDEAENNQEQCFLINMYAPELMAGVCHETNVRFVTFSSDLVFDGNKQHPYVEGDSVKSLNVYGSSKASGEKLVRRINAESLIIRTSSFFGPWDTYNFAHRVIQSLENGQTAMVAKDVIISPTYIPDLVNKSLDLLIDEEIGTWHISNDASLSWFEFAEQIADRAGFEKKNLIPKLATEMNWKARRPLYSPLQSCRGIKLPNLDSALERYFHKQIA